MNSMMSSGLAILSAIVAIISFWMFQSKDGGTLWVVVGIIGIIATIAFGAMYMTGRVNKTEDIHITE
ncbi:MAG: hypothetical protein KIS76_07845 [Pyrinomonadaceae bacterium]|nr:hypothetical protein [Pyrinomonadaceae bacterium]